MRNRNGFTLIELMIVIAIIGILAAIAVPNFFRYQSSARIAEKAPMTCGVHWLDEEENPSHRLSEGFVVQAIHSVADGYHIIEVRRVVDGFIYIAHDITTGEHVREGAPVRVGHVECDSEDNRGNFGSHWSYIISPIL